MVWNRRLWITADVPGDDTPFHTAGKTANHPETAENLLPTTRFLAIKKL